MEVDTQKDIEFYFHLVDTLGQEEADKVAPGIFAEDLSWMSWEACRSSLPKAFFYKIVNIEGSFRLVNQRDLLTSEDILGKINKNIRGGLEFFQISKVRSRLISAENGTVVTWISPKKMFDEDMDYPLDQINIAKKIDEETVWVKQLQGDFIKPEPNQKLADLMLTIGDEDLGFSWEIDFGISNMGIGQNYFEAIKQGLSADGLKAKRGQILFGQGFSGSVSTSCGIIDFRGGLGSSLPTWCERCGTSGELRCKICKKDLKRPEVSSHRCIC